MQNMATLQTTERLNDTARWKAVTDRDRTADGLFVYAVRSTGVYCRPSCPSRRPLRDRAVFFDTPADARGAGFRACKRCAPDGSVVDPWIDKVRRATVYLANVDGHPSLARLAERLGGSPYHLQRNFRRIVGVTPREYAEACRLRTVKRRLRQGADVTGAMLDAGYGSSSRFYERAVPKLGMSPSTYRRGGTGLSLRYALIDSPLGRLLIAATDRGVCGVSMGASDADLLQALRDEYPGATISVDAGALSTWTTAILAHLAGRRPRLDLPLDIQATAFQWQVWQALSEIPYGETRTYGAIARTIGKPTAVRAVARACAANPVAVAIPCHRVVPASGGTGGYRWGIARKNALLRREQRHRAKGGV
ncbi:MAG TPA: bifunctional DNA-binding transcriptional regulator/O6-methylguanine-DNA methyltransferase Ada [Vicinamibacterales bacterium]|jgi:AraC family transcriptional regulator of adaptative response/methylated-DNA-[protein]-cysteine methyltransferase|nr:bifunctional DNA-binding transcriptional regulator/O6-methylguanine-DNA methyltransferase Ada [Vicinamibacterales bacterium]